MTLSLNATPYFVYMVFPALQNISHCSTSIFICMAVFYCNTHSFLQI